MNEPEAKSFRNQIIEKYLPNFMVCMCWLEEKCLDSLLQMNNCGASAALQTDALERLLGVWTSAFNTILAITSRMCSKRDGCWSPLVISHFSPPLWLLFQCHSFQCSSSSETEWWAWWTLSSSSYFCLLVQWLWFNPKILWYDGQSWRVSILLISSCLLFWQHSKCVGLGVWIVAPLVAVERPHSSTQPQH